MLKRSLPFILIASLALAACGAAATQTPAAFEYAPAATAAPALAEAPAPASGVGGGFAQDQAATTGAGAERIVIKNASLSLLVKDPAASSDEIAKLAESLGGFVISTNVYGTTYGPNNTPVKQASISIRVPAERLTEALTRIKALAVDVTSENVSGQDVTSEYTDLQSRLKNLEAAEKQLQTIMDGATKTEDVLNVYNQLVSVREQIEVIKGQIKYYEESAAFSQVSIELVPDVVAQPLDIGGWRPEGVAKEAFEALIKSLQTLVNILIYLGICGVPFAIVFVLPTVLAVRYGWKRWRKTKEKPAAG
ncbi:MAG: DUF4349 domain-containing protein [Chloroflexi bacterium]|nr:DUF4349 domain-containing protein [Chloroflexota bacterium]